MNRSNRSTDRLYSSMRFEGDGVTTRVPLTFDLRKGDGLAVDFGEGLVTEGYIVDFEVTPTVVIFKEPLPKGKTVTIRRLVYIGKVKHVFQWTGNAQGGADFSALNLDENFEQIVRASQDAMDAQMLATETLEEMAGIKDAAIEAQKDSKQYAQEAKENAQSIGDVEKRVKEQAVKAERDAAASKQSAEDAEKWAKEAENIAGFNPKEYRKKDDLLFKGMVQVQAADNVGTGVFLLDKDGNPRGQMTYNSGGLQFAQRHPNGSSQTYTLPPKDGELLVDSSKNTTTLRDLGLKQGKANAEFNASIMQNIENTTLFVEKGDWWLSTNEVIKPSVFFVSPSFEKINFKVHVRTRQGGSSGSVNVPERYTQFVSMLEGSTLKFYVNDVEKPYKWLNYNTIEAQGTLRTDTVKFVITDCFIYANEFNINSNTNISSGSLEVGTARDNYASGNYTLRNLTSGVNNLAVGSKALMSNRGAVNNSAVGFQALYRLVNGNENTAMGSIAGEWMEGGNNNSLYGCGAGGKWRNPTGSVAIGWHAGWDLSNPTYSVAVGYRAHASTGYVSPSNTVAIGAFAMDFTAGDANTAVGYRALNCQYTGSNHVTTTTTGNTAIGAFTLRYLQRGENNVTLGVYAGGTSKHIDRSVLIGSSAGYDAANKIEYSVAIGNRAWREGSGVDNVHIGRDAGLKLDGNFNTTVGAGSNITASTGSRNTIIGADSARLNTDGSVPDSYDNVSTLGYGTRVSGNDQVQLGNASTTTYVYGTVQNRSDARDKKDIKELELGLDFVMKLNPRQFKWDYREWEGKETGKRDHVGFIAQELQEVLSDTNYAFVQDHTVNGGADVLSVGYDEFIGVLTKAIQEQQRQIDELKTRMMEM